MTTRTSFVTSPPVVATITSHPIPSASTTAAAQKAKQLIPGFNWITILFSSSPMIAGVFVPKGSFTQAIWVGNLAQQCDFKIEKSVSNRNRQ